MAAHLTRSELADELDRTNARICREQRRMLELVALADERALWEDSGARDMAAYLSIRYGISCWKANRWIAAAHALRSLPAISRAFESGEIGIDKVVELCRIATPQTEQRLLRWAKSVSCGAIRARAELEAKRSRAEAAQAEQARRLDWWFDSDGFRFSLQAELSAAEGAVVAGAIERVASQIPVMPGEEEPCFADARRADALVVLCSGAGAGAGGSSSAGANRPTLVIHAPLEVLATEDGCCSVEVDGRSQGALVHVETVRRLACTGRVQVATEDEHANAVALGRASRVPSLSMMRQLRWRDRECRFPGCGARRFTLAHHVRWWSHGGRTDLDNLVLLCTFHHKLVHEYGWSLVRDPDGAVRWYRPDGRRYRASPPPSFAEPPPSFAEPPPSLSVPPHLLERYERFRANRPSAATARGG